MRIPNFLFILTCLSFIPTKGFALDSRVKVIFKTAGYGAATGALLGVGSLVVADGEARNVLLGASLGLYTGILFGVYIVATADEERPAFRDLNERRQPVRPQEYNGDFYREEEIQQLLPAPPKTNKGSGLLQQRSIQIPLVHIVF